MNEKSLKSKTVSGMFWKLLERTAAQAVTFIVSVILARLLTPEDYSVINIVAIFFAFANVFIYSGLNTALIQKKDADNSDYSSVLYLSIIFAVIIYALIFAFSPLIASIYNKDILISVLRIMGLTLIINAFNSVLCAFISNRLEFKKFFFATIIGTVVSAFTGIIMAKNGCGPWALVAQQMSNALIDTVVLWIITGFKPIKAFSLNRLKPLFNYSWKLMASAFINTLYDESYPLIIGIKFSPGDLAFYSKGRQMPSIMNSVIGDSISAVIFPVMAKMQDSRESLLNYTRTFIKATTFLIFPVMLGAFAVSDNLIIVLLTEKWLPASIYLKLFCVAFMFTIIHNAHLQTIRATGKSNIILKLEIVKKISYTVIILLALFFSDKPQVLAFVSIITALIATVLNTQPNVKLIGYKYIDQFRDVSMNFMSSIIMCITVYALNYIHINNKPVLLTIQIFTGAVVYFVINLIVKNEALSLLKDIVWTVFKSFGEKDNASD